MAARTVLLNLIGQDRISRVLQRIRRETGETGRQVDQLNRTSRRAGRDIDRSFAVIMKRAAKFASIGLGAGLAITQAAQLAAALAPLAGLLAGIPAGVALAGAALGTLKLALSGVGDAFGAALGGDAKKFEESLKGLAPAAQSVARELRALRPQLLGIRSAAQQAFFGPLQGQLRATAGVLAGPLRQGVKGVAAEYGLAAAGALKFARQGRTVGALSTVFAATRKAIAGIRPALTPILAGFRDMAVQGVGTLSKLAAGAGNVGVRFGEWMQSFAASGGVQRALEGALAVVEQLGGLLSNVGGILGSVIKAAQGGGGLLGFLSQATAQLNAFLKTAAAQQALRSFFQTMNTLGTALAPIVPVIGQLAAALITALMPVVQQVAPVISQVVGALGRTVTALVPAFAPLSQLLVVVAKGIGQVFTAIGPLLPQLATMITQLLTGLVPVLTPVVQLIAQTASQIGGALVHALVAMMPSLIQLVGSVVTLLPVWAQLTPLFTQVLVALLPLAPPLTRIATILAGLLVPVLSLAIGVLVKYWSVITGLIVPVVNKLGAVFTWAAGALQVAVTAIGAGAVWLWRSAILPAWNGIKVAISAAWGIIKPIFDVIATVLKVVVGGAFLVLWNVVKVVFVLIAAAVKVAWNVLKWVFGLISSVISKTLGPVFRWLYDKVVKPVWSKVGGVIQDVWQRWIKPAFDKVKQAVGKVGDAFSLAVSAIKRHWDKLKDVAKTPVNFVIGLYNDGIVSLVNKLAGFAGVKTRLSKIPKFASGGVMPGYSPGVDSLIAAVSPGEAIMRPEFTRAVGSGFVLKANDVARHSGVEGVRRWLGGPHGMGGEGLAFARGGVVPGFAGRFAFGGVIGRFVKGVKDWTIGNVGKAASSLLGKILKPVPGAGAFRDVVNAIPVWIKDQILKWIKSKVGGGGPGAKKALAFARAQEGKPYVWGGVGPGGYDCSGFMSALTNVIQGKSPYGRRFTTFSFTGAKNGPAGFVNGLRSAFTVGVTNAGVGHMAGTLLGHNVESSGSAGVRVDGGARGTSNGLFTERYGLKFDQGGYLPRGLSAVYNGTRSPEPVLTSGQFDALAARRSDGPLVHIEHMQVREEADVDLLAGRLGFAARAAAF